MAAKKKATKKKKKKNQNRRNTPSRNGERNMSESNPNDEIKEEITSEDGSSSDAAEVKEATVGEDITEEAAVASESDTEQLSEEAAVVAEESIEEDITDPEENSQDADEVTQAPPIPGNEEDDATEELSNIVTLIEARKEYFAQTTITPAVKNTICGSMAEIAIKLYEVGDTAEFDAYLKYLVEYPAQISSISYGMDIVVKNGQKQRDAVNLMHAAFMKLARARRNKTTPKLNVGLVARELSNKDVVNYISSQAG